MLRPSPSFNPYLSVEDDLFVPSVDSQNPYVQKAAINQPNGITIEDMRMTPELVQDGLTPLELMTLAQGKLKSSELTQSVGNINAYVESVQRQAQNQPTTAFGFFGK